jgi:hypothetical protein
MLEYAVVIAEDTKRLTAIILMTIAWIFFAGTVGCGEAILLPQNIKLNRPRKSLPVA